MTEKYIPTEEELERHRRIDVAVWAYAYEIKSDPLVDDGTFDKKCLEIDITKSTGNIILDEFFQNEFDAYTGQWIHKHPDLEGLDRVYNRRKMWKNDN